MTCNFLLILMWSGHLMNKKNYTSSSLKITMTVKRVQLWSNVKTIIILKKKHNTLVSTKLLLRTEASRSDKVIASKSINDS